MRNLFICLRSAESATVWACRGQAKRWPRAQVRSRHREAVGCVDSQPWPIADGPVPRTFAAMVPQHVELVFFEQSLGKGEGLHRRFCDRVADAAEKTAGLFLAR